MSMDTEGFFAEPHDGKIHVHVDNAEDLRPVQRTQEVEPGHYTTQSFVLPPTGAQTPQADYNQNVPVNILQLDPLRKRAIISVSGVGSCFICASQAQAQSLQFGSSQSPDSASLVTAPFSFPAEATAPLWAVLANPGAVNQIVLGATGVAAYNNNSVGVNQTISGGTVTAIAINGVTTGLTSGTFFVPAGGTVTVTYSVAPTTFTTSAVPSAVTVGVMQERRDQ
jgi:hypothetical protein